jgi:hypothetical protein
LAVAAGPDVHSGKVVLMNLLAWRSLILKRKAIGSKDAKSKTSWKLRTGTPTTLWSELHGRGSGTI